MTDHPCKGMTSAAVEAFEQIAICQPHRARNSTLDDLLKRGLIVKGEPKRIRDRLGAYEIPTYDVPIPIHMQWCAWCSEQPGDEP